MVVHRVTEAILILKIRSATMVEPAAYIGVGFTCLCDHDASWSLIGVIIEPRMDVVWQ